MVFILPFAITVETDKRRRELCDGQEIKKFCKDYTEKALNSFAIFGCGSLFVTISMVHLYIYTNSFLTAFYLFNGIYYVSVNFYLLFGRELHDDTFGIQTPRIGRTRTSEVLGYGPRNLSGKNFPEIYERDS